MIGSFADLHVGEDGVQALVALLGLLAVSLDPLRHEVEHLRLEVARAALGVAASVDVPLTDRRIASSVTFLSGHASEDAPADGHTYVVYMGVREAAAVRDRLLGAGLHPKTPVAIVENGTRTDERVSKGSLIDLARLAAAHTKRGDAGPSLIIAGEVAARAASRAELLLAKVS